MSIFKVAVAVLEARTANMAEARALKAKAHEEYLKNLSPYDKTIVGQETSLSDGFTLELRKQPMGYCEITVSHNKGLKLSKVVRYNRAFTNVIAAHDCGAFDQTIEELTSQITNLLPQQSFAVVVI